MDVSTLTDRLNDGALPKRLGALYDLVQMERFGAFDAIEHHGDVNNHIHTWYSFSPYSPAKAIWMAHRAGLATAGIMDHDSISGAAEFHDAAKIAGMKVTSGVELRVSFKDTPFSAVRINNPDQIGNAYIALHAVPECKRGELKVFLEQICEARAGRNIEMTVRINELVSKIGVGVDYTADVIPLSKKKEGGSVTERHILFALAKKLTEKYGRSKELIKALTDGLALAVSEKNKAWLSDTQNPAYEYDLLGVLKSDFVQRFYIPAGSNECPDVKTAIRLAGDIGAISAYAYLGDVGSSVTGDKKAQSFEDGYIDELFPFLAELGFNAVTYMPSRNTAAQLKKVRELCKKHGLFEISGEDINSPRQNFVCLAARAPEFSNLKDAAYSIIGSEKAARNDAALSMFSKKSAAEIPDLDKRAEFYKNLA